MDPLICPRTATVQELARIVLEEGVVHVRGTPTSGKTTLALLLHKYNTDNDVKSVYIRQWSPMKSIEHFGTYHLVWHARAAGFTSVSYDNFESQDITFILDNAQTSYKDDQLWLGPLKDQNNNCRQFGPRFCLFMSYGSPTEGPDDPSPNSIRSGIKILQRVSITVSRLENSPQISLFFTREEFDDVLQRKRCDQKRPVPLDSNAADYLFHLTNGHPGAVEAVLAMIHKVYETMILFEAYLVLIRQLVGTSIGSSASGNP
ncbi:hypothetical protein EIK77_010331 [Talaromyces pinophilus]|nr:hypothetical protein EIK77_010331 [Talaromyces pinophilus]